MDEGLSILKALKNLNINKILSGANKTLNFVNKAIPMYQQIKPTFGNIKNLLNVYGAVKEDEVVKKDDIKESRPIPINFKKKQTIKKTEDRSLSNDNSLKFFQ